YSQEWVRITNNSKLNETMKTYGHLHLSLNYNFGSNHFKQEDFVSNRTPNRNLLKYGVISSSNLPFISSPLEISLLKTKGIKISESVEFKRQITKNSKHWSLLEEAQVFL
ncbi:uncharacterized protein LOC113550099, partial [Rhopalosiphum maidis]|uniref:uncharacterized protein LOC113550099 n=1 Tax=Rhopalosiphum maidis TaxID=43146 RepID=UPI000EFDCE14